jgi:hypothetical protein
MDLTFKNSTDLAPIISYAAKSHALVEIIDERTVRVTAPPTGQFSFGVNIPSSGAINTAAVRKKT